MSQVRQHAGEEEDEEGGRHRATVDDEGHSAAASSLRRSVEVDEDGGTSCEPLKTKAEYTRENHALEYFGCEYRLPVYRSSFRGGCFLVILDERCVANASVHVRIGIRICPGCQETRSRRLGQRRVSEIWDERDRELWGAVSRIGTNGNLMFLRAILYNLCLSSNPVVGWDYTIITAYPLSSMPNSKTHKYASHSPAGCEILTDMWTQHSFAKFT